MNIDSINPMPDYDTIKQIQINQRGFGDKQDAFIDMLTQQIFLNKLMPDSSVVNQDEESADDDTLILKRNGFTEQYVKQAVMDELSQSDSFGLRKIFRQQEKQ